MNIKCAYCQALLGSFDTVDGLRRELAYWRTYEGCNYHKGCVHHHMTDKEKDGHEFVPSGF